MWYIHAIYSCGERGGNNIEGWNKQLVEQKSDTSDTSCSVSDTNRGWYSCYFVVPKKGGGLRPILDLVSAKQIPMHLQIQDANTKTAAERYKPRRLVNNVRSHRRLLSHSDTPRPQAVSGRNAYEYFVLSFGLLLAPCTFTKCVQAALAPLRQTRCSHISLSGRLGFSCQLRGVGSCAAVINTDAHPSTGVFSKSSEKFDDPQSTVFLPWVGNMLPLGWGMSVGVQGGSDLPLSISISVLHPQLDCGGCMPTC